MKLLQSDLRHGTVKVLVESLDDLWYLYHLILPGDKVSAKTMRRIKAGREDDRSQKAAKKPVFITIDVEKVEFSRDQNTLRVLGTITEGPDDVARGSHHAFTIEENTSLTIRKERFSPYQTEKLKEAARQKAKAILLVVMDRDEAIVAQLKRFGYDILSRHLGSAQKKREGEQRAPDFYRELEKVLVEYDQTRQPQHIIVASPAFFKEDFFDQLLDERLRKKIILATVSSCSQNAFEELLKRKEVEQALHEEKVAQEVKLVDALLVEIAKGSRGGKAAYGLADVEKNVFVGAAKMIVLTDAFIQKERERGEFGRIESIMQAAEQTGAEVHIISSGHEGGAKLDGIGGIAAMLRYAEHE